jgi:hypothetical protein
MSGGLLTLAGTVFNRRRDLVMCNRFIGSKPTKLPLPTIYLSLIQVAG